MNILQWCNIDECLLIAETDEVYKKYAGLKHSNESILSLAKLRLLNSDLFLKNYVEPLDLFLSVVENFADSSTKDLELKLHDIRTKKVVSKYKFNNKNINWNTWRQFNNNEKNSQKRKEVFDDFIEKTKYISPIIYNRFEKIRSLYSTIQSTCSNTSIGSNQLNPLSGYLMNEKITYKKINAVKEVKKILKILNFDLNRINFDIENRQNKYPSPICFFVRIPYDIRILYKSESPYFDLQGCFHESGHAMHSSSINPKKKYLKRYYISMGVAEIFSILLERLTKKKTFLKSSIGIMDDKLLDKLESRNNFMELFFVTFYSANALMKSSFWKNHLSIEASNLLYSKLVKDFTGIEIPGAYWMLHHILPEAIMYVPSYLFAAVRAKELDVHLQNIFGETWWKHKESGKYLQQIMSPGAEIDLSIFSKLDSDIFLKEIRSIK